MTTTTNDIANLEAKAAKAQEALQRAQAAAEIARRAEQARQDERARQIDQQILSEYDEEEHTRQIRHAQDDLARVVAESDIGKAWIAVQVAVLRQAHAAADYNGAASRLGLTTQVPGRPAGNVEIGALAGIIDRAAGDAIADELADRDDKRRARIAGA